MVEPAGVVRLTFAGDLESHSWEQFRDAITTAADDDATAVVIDLTDVHFFDSSAIRALLGARIELDQRDVTIYLGGRSPLVQQVIDVTGIDQIFPSWPSTEQVPRSTVLPGDEAPVVDEAAPQPALFRSANYRARSDDDAGSPSTEVIGAQLDPSG